MPLSETLHRIRANTRAALLSPHLRELLMWCLPALLVGAIVRGVILWHFPYGYVHPDTEDFLITADQLLHKHHFVLHGKKAFLGPLLFALPLLIKVPTLLIIPWAQHLFGLIFTVIMGALVRLWTRMWKLWIIPVTMLATLNPAMLWYEHTLISEFQYLWCVAALLLAGTVCALRPGKWTFALLLAAVLLTAGARPEGKLFVMFCLMLVALIHWGSWKKWMTYVGIALVFCGLTWESARDTQAGLLLYATVLPLAPDLPKSAPGFGTYIDPFRDERIARGPLFPDELVKTEKVISALAVKYLKAVRDKEDYHVFCQRLAIEAALNHPMMLPLLAVNKFLLVIPVPTSGDFGPLWMQQKQQGATTYKDWMVRLMPPLVGPKLTWQPDVSTAMKNLKAVKKDSDLFLKVKVAITEYVHEDFVPLGTGNWFEKLQQAWAVITTDGWIGTQHHGAMEVPGVPLFFALSLMGMLASLCRPGKLWKMHAAWIVTLGFVFTAVMLTGVVNARYRFVFEPFCLLYVAALLDLPFSLLARREDTDETRN